MRIYDLLGAKWVRCKWFTAAGVVLWSFGLVAPVLAQDGDANSAALPNAPSPQQPESQQYVGSSNRVEKPLTFGERVHIYGKDMFNVETIIGPAFGAGIGQWEDEPPDWGGGAEGYGDRIASGVGRHLIAETIRFGFAAVDHEDPRYFLSQDRGVWGRTKHAIVGTFVSNTTSGARIPAFSRFAGTYGAAFISNTWYPSDRATAGYAARRGSTALAASVGFHLLREFMPFFRHGDQQ